MGRVFDDLFRAVWIRIASAMVLVIGWIGYLIAPGFQEQFFPVIAPGSSQVISSYVDADGWTNIQITFQKLRNCRSVAEKTEWFFKNEEGHIGVMPWDAAINSHSPRGVVISPALRMKVPDEAVSIFARVLYNCDLPWEVYATLGPFPYPIVIPQRGEHL